MIGETLSHYEIVGKIGAGGMGEVYRARDPRLGREVAIKVLHPSYSQNPARLARFEQEARSAGALNHPNVLAVHDVGHDQGMPFLVTELLDGETLRERIESGSLTQRKAVEYAAQVADGLAAAHNHAIVHRDLKPENIFITRDGHLKILDFGLAKLTERDPENPVSTESPTEAFTEAGAVVGTPGYMSPEQLHGEPADQRSDIFAFGIILYEMISGRRPFVGSTAAEVCASIMRDEPAPLVDSHGPVPPTLDRVVRQCLEKSPSERFESAHDLGHLLRAVSDTGEVSVSLPPLPRMKTVWQRVAGVATVAALIVAVVIGLNQVDLKPAPSMPDAKHIYVEPFSSLGSDPEDRFLAAGLAETVADGLEIMERETRGTAWVIRPDPIGTLEEVRNRHNVALSIRGQLQTGGERVRLDLMIIEAASGRTLDIRTLDDNIRNLAGLQKEPVLVVWEMLGFEPSRENREELEGFSTNTLSACQAYVNGRGRLLLAETENELREAAASLDQAASVDPSHVLTRVALADAYARLFVLNPDIRWKERAIAEAKTAIDMDEESVAPYLTLGQVYTAAEDQALGLDAYRKAAARAGTAGPFFELAIAAADAGETEEAERALQTAINLRPDHYEGHHRLGYHHIQLNRYDAAANEFRYASRASPRFPDPLVNLGAVLYFLERREEAKKAFEDSLALGPHPFAYSNLGGLYFEEGRFGDAVEMFERALSQIGEEISPRHYHLVGNLASALYWSGDPEKSAARMEQAIELGETFLADSGGDFDITVNLAGYYGSLDRPDRGFQLLEDVEESEITDALEMAAIAEAYVDLGDTESALIWLEAAFEDGLSPLWVERRPSFNSIRGVARYREMIDGVANRS